MSDDFVYRDEREELDLELEDIGPPPASRTLAAAPLEAAPAPGTPRATAARQAVALPQPQGQARAAGPRVPPVRTLELRVAEAVDRLPESTRLGLLGLLVVCMVLVATSVLMIGWKRVVTQAIEDVQAQPGPLVVP